jgi:hypothetical protein
VNKVLLKVGEAGVAQKVLFGGESTEIDTLTLAVKELSVLGCGEVDKAVEFVFAVKLEERLKGGQTGEVKLLHRLEVLDLVGLTLKDNFVLLVAGAKSKCSGKLSGCRDGEVSRVAEVVLSFRERCAGQW